MAEFKIPMGSEVEHTVTGFKGKVAARCEYLGGDKTYLVQPGVKEMGEWVEGHWLDERHLIYEHTD